MICIQNIKLLYNNIKNNKLQMTKKITKTIIKTKTRLKSLETQINQNLYSKTIYGIIKFFVTYTAKTKVYYYFIG